jgi:hypothetical protein
MFGWMAPPPPRLTFVVVGRSARLLQVFLKNRSDVTVEYCTPTYYTLVKKAELLPQLTSVCLRLSETLDVTVFNYADLQEVRRPECWRGSVGGAGCRRRRRRRRCAQQQHLQHRQLPQRDWVPGFLPLLSTCSPCPPFCVATTQRTHACTDESSD